AERGGLRSIFPVEQTDLQRVSRTATPPAERHAIGSQRRASVIPDEPVAMRLKDSRSFLRDERRDPNRRFEPSLPDPIEDRADVAFERGAGVEPVAHRALIAIVYLDVFQRRDPLRDDVEIVEHLLCGDARAETVPLAPARRPQP